MKNKKLIYSILSLIFIILFSIFNFEEYKNFHKEKIQILNQQNEIKSKLKKFTLKDIKKINDLNFYHTPNKGLLSEIIENINNAKKEIFLEVYMLTEKRIQEALIKAKNKWINIKIILEKDPYLAYNINNKAYEKLKKAWINIVWSKKDHYSYNHSKILIIDDLSIISTWNYSYSTFTKNRDLFILTSDKNIRKKLLQNFNNDFYWINVNIYDDNLIFSPNSSRIKFSTMFNEAQKNINMYFQYFKDDELVNELIKIKQNKNIDINVIIPNTAKNDINVIKLKNNWIKINIMSKYKMHSKAILIDEKHLFIWSINFSENSINKNREVWILIINEKIINEFLELFKQDIKNTILQ